MDFGPFQYGNGTLPRYLGFQLSGRETFICAFKTPASLAGDEVCEWVGQVTLLGPPVDAPLRHRLPESAQQPPVVPDQEEEKWQMLNLFILPMHRGKGIAKSLCSEVFRWLREHKRAYGRPRPEQIRVRVMVKPENIATVKLYEGLGFMHTGKCTLAEALKANGDGKLVPADGGGPKYRERSGLIMATTFERH
ncbi:hypothetical protein GT037_008756 [Alternaria burnsii]|uniref:N-acetyltransferase domain-containing protein n=1 Tax=Alternaria burnsii TaxID=1187904 RepID=A0A8H7AZ85_9PLEO|nr:uncharacterized protein GT037_008756 [Alternaria burnsii]KAF7673433.1 hypothetical protein GT037_008756 [Alternaria burnsii]